MDFLSATNRNYCFGTVEVEAINLAYAGGRDISGLEAMGSRIALSHFLANFNVIGVDFLSRFGRYKMTFLSTVATSPFVVEGAELATESDTIGEEKFKWL
ncbi:hypothetical protein NC652_002091 [Populus alba x Populus x berolinensis]|nr:hypothetical protein NC652_002091 [Populus alba x Populus x berolinensis]